MKKGSRRRLLSFRRNASRGSSRSTSRLQTSKNNSFSTFLGELDEEGSSWLEYLRHLTYHDFKNAMLHFKYGTSYGILWDVLLVLFSLVACAVYVMETYWASYYALKTYSLVENVITQFFLIDFIIGWVTSHSTRVYLTLLMTWIDLATIAPVYVSYVMSGRDDGPNLSILRFLRILRLIRILKTFRLLGGMSGVKRQTVTLSLAIISIVFLAAGIIHIFENEIQQQDYACQYINELTGYAPSCSAYEPTYDSVDCDCRSNNCESYYEPSDKNHEPSTIKCQTLAFFESLFFIIITIYPVGYGSMISTEASRFAILILIIASLIVIPIQINKLTLLISMSSKFRRPFKALSYENHVLLCGFCNDKEKLSRILREFFNPDRISKKTPLFHMVIMTPHEPSEDVVDLMNSPLFESRLTYVIGSALNEKDLLKARADVASAIFFVSDSQADHETATCEDAATVLRTLSIINYNQDLECFVEVLNEHDRRLLEDCQADVVVCLNDYKFTLLARNSICMGLNTMCENLFNSFGNDGTVGIKPTEHWLSEYKYGAGMEFYFFNIDLVFFSRLRYNWALLVECIFLEFGCMLLGVCRRSDYTVHLNPRDYCRKFNSLSEYYKEYSVGVVLAADNDVVLDIQYVLSQPKIMDSVLTKLYEAEELFVTREAKSVYNLPPKSNTPVNQVDYHRNNTSHDYLSKQEEFHLMRAQKGFDSAYSLNKIYKRTSSLRHRTLSNSKSLHHSLSTSRSCGFDSDSSDDGMDDFLGYIDSDSERSPDRDLDKNASSSLTENSSCEKTVKNNRVVRKKRISLENAAWHVTKLLKEDSWSNALAITHGVNLHGDIEQPDSFNLYPSVTHLQRRIMKAKAARRTSAVSDTRVFASKKLKRVMSSLGSQQLECKNDNELPGEKKKTKNFTQTLNKFHKQNTLKRTNSSKASEPLHRLQSFENTVTQEASPSSDLQKEAQPPANSSARQLSYHRYNSSSFQKQSSDVTEIVADVGEIMGVTSRALSKHLSRSGSYHGGVKATLLRAGSFEDKLVANKAITTESPRQVRELSVEVSNAKFLSNHIILMGSFDNITKFVKSLRKSNLCSHEHYRAILIVGKDEPADWEYIQNTYKDVFFLRRDTKTDKDFLYMNVREASSLCIFGSRHRHTLDEETNIDANVLFFYLAIEKKIPSHVNITVEIFRPSSVGVMNSAVDHHQYVVGNSNGQSTGMSRKAHSTKGAGLMVSGTSSKSFCGGMSDELVSIDDSDEEENDYNDVMSRRLGTARVAPIMVKDVKSLDKEFRERLKQPSARTASARSGKRVNIAGMAPILSAADGVDSNMRRSSSTGTKPIVHQAFRFWGCSDTHHVTPVFAAGRAFVPTAFDSIIVQLLLLGLYRQNHRRNEAHLPYVFTNPPTDTILHDGDHMYVYGHPELAANAKESLSTPIRYNRDGSCSMCPDPWVDGNSAV